LVRTRNPVFELNSLFRTINFPVIFYTCFIETPINIGFFLTFWRFKTSKKEKFPVKFPVNTEKQGKHTLAKSPAEV
jgi:hypothetical protein